jgi:hypothetical protein
MKQITSSSILCIVLSLMARSATSTPLDLLKEQKPSLYKLYLEGAPYLNVLDKYAQGQGFRAPIELLATTIHELVHLSSAIHQGYFIDGIYYEPYLNRAAWPSLTNQHIARYVTDQERGIIFSVYSRNTPSNHLGNVLDEINAYSAVAGFVCKNEPASGAKQVRNLIGHLQLQEAYLRTVRHSLPSEYAQLVRSRESSGAVVTITKNAWSALESCRVHSDQVVRSEALHFIELVERPR